MLLFARARSARKPLANGYAPPFVVGPPVHRGRGYSPRCVWYKDSDKVFEGRLVNRSSGSYKGYLLDSREWPKDIEELYVHS